MLYSESQVQILSYEEWPVSPSDAHEMKFRLIYQGKLPAASQEKTRVPEKQHIRRIFHKQLRELWRRDPFLKTYLAQMIPVREKNGTRQITMAEFKARNYQRCGYNFLPLISAEFEIACGIEILFLRRDEPGKLIKQGGDIDNRIKVLFDAFRMPQTCDELNNEKSDGDDDPFYCLLESDSLINEVQVTTDRLLTAVEEGGHENDVHLIIQVRTIMTGGSAFARFLGD